MKFKISNIGICIKTHVGKIWTIRTRQERLLKKTGVGFGGSDIFEKSSEANDTVGGGGAGLLAVLAFALDGNKLDELSPKNDVDESEVAGEVGWQDSTENGGTKLSLNKLSYAVWLLLEELLFATFEPKSMMSANINNLLTRFFNLPSIRK
ncbi:hypothetical protein HELRODRAFT_168548 [Helobdella robusta]|uniref:Uncharacterized protein n=1 Tax=Helobdella robusta TaxID=6412 RepID=T1F0P8_HELRO|nr:hypothetical protein HELRODRAFT_168548 [Helobdella robusta]ESO09547.1 hypothetical protein HELRODRAFT_168548 [Helobdella robusta]